MGFLLVFIVVLAGCGVGKLVDKLTEEIMSSSVSSESTQDKTSTQLTASSGEDSVAIESAIEDIAMNDIRYPLSYSNKDGEMTWD
ncbi:hypothetical protein CAR_c13010 [Carnobacterium sp. 17-4]|uniref:hypothetical protein n=1 Tax=Carnobacterium sp. (strain 17-4) TaxID=208596 RepID=UPI0002058813|nr:hypothetical protein [Carnobacterium sp. 17-4]AEB29993.1 hypothetical protein CAR_c13010 [Carnobacterium sp. 17-4]